MDHKEGWAQKNCCLWIAVMEKTLESPVDCKGIKLINPKGNQPWIFIGRTDAETGAPILWPPDGQSHLIVKANSLEKTLMLGRTEGNRRRGRQRMIWLDSITDAIHMNLIKLCEIMEDKAAQCAKVHVVAKSQTWLSNWFYSILFLSYWKW